jgi:hypothetical protein
VQYRLLSGIGLIALIAFALAGIQVPAIAADGSRLLLLCILITAGFSAAYHRHRKRAFWLGFLVVMLLQVVLPVTWSERFIPTWVMAEPVSAYLPPGYPGSTPLSFGPRYVLYSIIWGSAVVITSIIGGFIASAVYSNARQEEGRGRDTDASPGR